MDGSTPPRRLLDQVRDAIRLKHYPYRTERSYVQYNACGKTMSQSQRETPSEITLSPGLVAPHLKEQHHSLSLQLFQVWGRDRTLGPS
ncbi:hypothetical protein [Phormidium sp. FACHB-77]|uniref:hypothetical protein n=1 Tax=Phormidium sp. FACHB-77 TaxID=2692851 RepID=UPI0018EF9346|nr:hypothetical protein [Phormidium sp. FACHB-77]